MRKTLTVLTVTVLLLLAVGIVLVAAAGGVRGIRLYSDPHHFLIRQLIWLAVAGGVGLAASRFDYHWWKENQNLTIMVLGLVVLSLILVRCVGRPINGSYRWLTVGPLSVQPGEFAKIMTVIAMSVWLSRIGWRVRLFKMGVLVPAAGLSVLAGLLVLEPDYGTTMVVGLIGGVLMFVAGARLIYLVPIGLVGMACVAVKVLLDPNRVGRLTSWNDGTVHQVKQSLLAFQSGGLWGVGFNKGLQKYNYLPEAHTDFIYAIGGEELGFFFSIGVVVAYAVILICGMRISMRAPDTLGRLLAFGMTFLLVFQGAWNIAVVTGCTITKGLALPFVSYGGSNLITALAAIGTLVNIGRHVDVCDESMHTQVVKNAPVSL